MKTAYVVLGMHRSGTSSVAGALALLGAAAPRTLMTPKPENPKGFWESEVIMALNDRILSACGSSWHDPRGLDLARLNDAQRRDFETSATADLAAEFGDAEAIVLKDPRICRFYGFWRAALAGAGYEALVVSPIRSPAEVTASLSARNPMSSEQGFQLWLRHVLDAEVASRGHRRHLMAWDDFMADFPGQLEIMSRRLGRSLGADLIGREDIVADFISPELRRQRAGPARAAVPSLVEDVHAALLDIARHGETENAHHRLDVARIAFDAATARPDAVAV